MLLVGGLYEPRQLFAILRRIYSYDPCTVYAVRQSPPDGDKLIRVDIKNRGLIGRPGPRVGYFSIFREVRYLLATILVDADSSCLLFCAPSVIGKRPLFYVHITVMFA
jgi:hypothetical protein